jgi:hypothetical protein
MTKEELIGLVKLNLGNAGNLHENQIHLNICMAWDQMLFAIYNRWPAGIDRYAKTYSNVAITKDTATGAYYSILPMTPIRFVDVAEGLRRIVKTKQMGEGDDIIFVPMPIQQTQLISQVDAGQVADVTGYYVKDERVWYYLMNENITSVNMDIVPSLEKMEYTDEVVIPAGGVQMLIGITNEILKGVPYVDPRLRKINLQEI